MQLPELDESVQTEFYAELHLGLDRLTVRSDSQERLTDHVRRIRPVLKHVLKGESWSLSVMHGGRRLHVPMAETRAAEARSREESIERVIGGRMAATAFVDVGRRIGIQISVDGQTVEITCNPSQNVAKLMEAVIGVLRQPEIAVGETATRSTWEAYHATVSERERSRKEPREDCEPHKHRFAIVEYPKRDVDARLELVCLNCAKLVNFAQEPTVVPAAAIPGAYQSLRERVPVRQPAKIAALRDKALQLYGDIDSLCNELADFYRKEGFQDLAGETLSEGVRLRSFCMASIEKFVGTTGFSPPAAEDAKSP